MWLGSLERVQLSALGRWNCQTKTHLDRRPGLTKTRLDIRTLPRRLRAQFSQRLFPWGTRMGFEFGAVLAFAVVTVGFALGMISLSRLVGPRIPNAEKATIYECGERPIGIAWFNFNPRFYLVALVFVIFEVDIALTFPVATVYRDWVAAADPSFAWIAFGELFLFTLILVVGLVWVWAHGDLEWVKTLDKPSPEEAVHPGSSGGSTQKAA